MVIGQDTKNSPPSLQKWGGNMRISFLLACSNLRRSKGQTIAIIILILLASFMLNLCLILSMDYKQNFDRYHDKLNAEHATLVVDGDSTEMREFLTQTLENDQRTADFSLDHSMQMVGLFAYNNGEVNSNLVILDKQTAVSRSVGKVEIVEDSEFTSGIYMPILYKSGDIAIGNTVKITLGNNEMCYTVCGFFNSIMGGSHNCGLCELVLTEDNYKALAEMGYATNSLLCSVRIRDKSESEDYETMLKNIISSRYPTARKSSNSYTLVAQSRYISQMICSGIISVMAFLILLIALIVIASNIANYIQENMKNLGVLKAIGYTNRQLTGSFLLQFSALCLLAAIVGVGISYSLFPFVNTLMSSQTGIPYQIRFLPLPMLNTLVIAWAAVAVVVWLSCRRIRKAEPIVALRQGVQTHNFKRNHVALETAKTPLSLSLALKTTLSGMKYTVTVCITMLMLSLVVVFSGLMMKNVITDVTPFLNLVVGETADSCINVNAAIENDFLDSLNTNEQVTEIYLYNSLAVSHTEGLELIATICDDFSKVTNQSMVFEGRFPKYDNEIAIGAKYAREQGLKTGGEITITTNGKEANYIITGLTQVSSNLGRDCLLTRSGFERMGKLQNVSYYINIVEGVDLDTFHAEINEQFGDNINATISILSVFNGVSAVYISLMTIIVMAIFVLSALVIVFVLYLLVRTMLNNKKRDYGILKALGFTTSQLILQTALSLMPAVVLSTIIGLIVSSLTINPLMALFLSSIGIVKCTFTVPVGFITIAGIGLILFAFVIACLLSLKIKKIAPRALLAGE